MTTLVGGGTLPVGTILAFGGPVSALPEGFLSCQGALVNRNDFAELFSVIGTLWGTDSGLDFRLPTLNGNLVRGRAAGSSSDPDRNSRTATQAGGSIGDNVGSLQTWRYQSHGHSWRAPMSNTHSNTGLPTATASYNGVDFSGGANAWGVSAPAPGVKPIGFNGNENLSGMRMANVTVNATGNAQTVGRNVYVEFIIKY